MSPYYRNLLNLVLAIMLCLSAHTQATAAEPTPSLSGAVSMVVTSLALGPGAEWGNGILTLGNGQQYRFTVKGLEMGSVGVEKAFLHGRVYHLTTPEHFEGLYGAIEIGTTFVGGAGVVAMRNKAGVTMYLESVEQGMALNLGTAGIDIHLKE